MVYESTVDIQQVKRCLLCDNAPCLKQCPKGVGPDHILRSLWFGNEIGCAMTVGQVSRVSKLQNASFAWNVAPMPAGPKGPAPVIGQAAIAANAKGKNVKLATELVAYMGIPI